MLKKTKEEIIQNKKEHIQGYIKRKLELIKYEILIKNEKDYWQKFTYDMKIMKLKEEMNSMYFFYN